MHHLVPFCVALNTTILPLPLFPHLIASTSQTASLSFSLSFHFCSLVYLTRGGGAGRRGKEKKGKKRKRKKWYKKRRKKKKKKMKKKKKFIPSLHEKNNQT